MISLRERTYEILGLELGSLENEGGRDWNEAEKEAKLEFNLTNNKKDTKEKTLDKEVIINSNNVSDYYNKAKIARDYKLSKDEIIKLISCNDNDVILAIIRNQNINIDILNCCSKNISYNVKKEVEAKLKELKND